MARGSLHPSKLVQLLDLSKLPLGTNPGSRECKLDLKQPLFCVVNSSTRAKDQGLKEARNLHIQGVAEFIPTRNGVRLQNLPPVLDFDHAKAHWLFRACVLIEPIINLHPRLDFRPSPMALSDLDPAFAFRLIACSCLELHITYRRLRQL